MERLWGTALLAALGLAVLGWAARAGTVASDAERGWRGYVSTPWARSYRLFGFLLLLLAALVALGVLTIGG